MTLDAIQSRKHNGLKLKLPGWTSALLPFLHKPKLTGEPKGGHSCHWPPKRRLSKGAENQANAAWISSELWRIYFWVKQTSQQKSLVVKNRMEYIYTNGVFSIAILVYRRVPVTLSLSAFFFAFSASFCFFSMAFFLAACINVQLPQVAPRSKLSRVDHEWSY